MDTNLLQQLLGELMLSKQAALVASNNNVLIWTIIATALAPLLVSAAGYVKSRTASERAEAARIASEAAKTASEKSEKVIADTAVTVGVIKTDVNSERTATLKLLEDMRKELLASKEEAAMLRERSKEK